MPAIDLNRLRKQIAHLAVFLEVPDEFVAEFKSLLEFYHQWAHRKHEDHIPASFKLVYDLPSQVMPEIELNLKPFLKQKASPNYALADALRQDLHFECSAVAAFILGQSMHPDLEALSAYLKDWLAVELDKAVIETIFEKAALPLQEAGQAEYMGFLQSLLLSSDDRLANAGLKGLTLFLPNSKIENLPRLFNLIRPLLQNRDLKQAALEPLIEALAKRSAVETGFFINQVLSDTDGKEIEVLARAFLQYLPEDTAASVRQAIKLHSLRTIQSTNR